MHGRRRPHWSAVPAGGLERAVEPWGDCPRDQRGVGSEPTDGAKIPEGGLQGMNVKKDGAAKSYDYTGHANICFECKNACGGCS